MQHPISNSREEDVAYEIQNKNSLYRGAKGIDVGIDGRKEVRFSPSHHNPRTFKRQPVEHRSALRKVPNVSRSHSSRVVTVNLIRRLPVTGSWCMAQARSLSERCSSRHSVAGLARVSTREVAVCSARSWRSSP
jgi:hypothetical protein